MSGGLSPSVSRGGSRYRQHLLRLHGGCIVSCMDNDEFRVVTFELTDVEIQKLSDHLDADATHIREPEQLRDDVLYSELPNLLRVIEFGLKQSSVLHPVAGAVGKSALDVVVDRVKKWLEKRREDRQVVILGPDGQRVRIVKTGKEIRSMTEAEYYKSRSLN